MTATIATTYLGGDAASQSEDQCEHGGGNMFAQRKWLMHDGGNHPDPPRADPTQTTKQHPGRARKDVLVVSHGWPFRRGARESSSHLSSSRKSGVRQRAAAPHFPAVVRIHRSEGSPRTRMTKSSFACDCGKGPVSVGAFFFLRLSLSSFFFLLSPRIVP